jgi:nucleotide-binding universal stress UspA family protein
MCHHILIATDGSERSNSAAAHGIQLAKSLGANVTGITVSAPFHIMSAEPFAVTDVPEEYEADAESAGRARLRIIQEAAQAADVKYEGMHVFHDHPYRAIIDEATSRGCDLIVMASHGRRGISALVLGSETTKVLTHSTIPTLVYR